MPVPITPNQKAIVNAIDHVVTDLSLGSSLVVVGSYGREPSTFNQKSDLDIFLDEGVATEQKFWAILEEFEKHNLFRLWNIMNRFQAVRFTPRYQYGHPLVLRLLDPAPGEKDYNVDVLIGAASLANIGSTREWMYKHNECPSDKNHHALHSCYPSILAPQYVAGIQAQRKPDPVYKFWVASTPHAFRAGTDCSCVV
jgi:hypothetical protein